MSDETLSRRKHWKREVIAEAMSKLEEGQPVVSQRQVAEEGGYRGPHFSTGWSAETPSMPTRSSWPFSSHLRERHICIGWCWRRTW